MIEKSFALIYNITKGDFMNKKAKIYRMNEIDWWCDFSKEEALKNYYNFTGEEPEEMLDEPIELTEEDMIRLKYCDEDGKTVRTFKAELEIILKNNQAPCFFGSLEY